MPTGAASGVGKLDYDFPVVITAMPINAAQRRAALAVVILLSALVIVTAPFFGAPVGRIDVFIPVLQAVACLIDLIIAAFLFSQYLIRPLIALLPLAAGYVSSGLFAFAQSLAFPGAYSANGLIGDGRNTAGWLFFLWHTVFPMAVLIYALTKDPKAAPGPPGRPAVFAVLVTVGAAVAATAVLIYAAATVPGVFPALFEDTVQQTAAARAADIFLWLLNIVTLVVLFFRRRTIMDLWLTVMLFAWWPNFFIGPFFGLSRFTVGWYLSRCLAVAAGSTLLFILLAEMLMLYARLANSFLLLRRERSDRLASVEAATAAMAHELRQPLSGIASLAGAARRWLNKTPAEVEKAQSCVASILAATHNSEQIITSVRRLSKKTPSHRALAQLNDLVRLVMRLARHDLLSHEISATSDYQDNLPLINADAVQLQQVILNLVKNAIDAMSNRPIGERTLRVATASDGQSNVSFYIRDSGPGVAEANRERIFIPFFTTKSHGMGLGLSICRTIIEEHGGSLRLTKAGPGGSTFEFTLPIASPQQETDEQEPTLGDETAPPIAASS